MPVPLTTAEKEAIKQAIALNTTAILRYQQDLADDAVTPLESYFLDGETTTHNEWREGIGRLLANLILQNKQLRKMLGGNVSIAWLGRTPNEETPYGE